MSPGQLTLIDWHYTESPILNTSYVLTHLLHTKAHTHTKPCRGRGGHYHYAHFRNVKTEAQKC